MPKTRCLLPGDMAPDFSLIDTNGKTRTLANSVGQNGLTLIFFSTHFLKTDCHVLQSYSQPEGDNPDVLGISGVNWESLHVLQKQAGLSFPLLFDPCCRVSKYYHAMWIPRFVSARVIYTLKPDQHIQSIEPF